MINMMNKISKTGKLTLSCDLFCFSCLQHPESRCDFIAGYNISYRLTTADDADWTTKTYSSTVTSAQIDNLPSGSYVVRVVVTDNAGLSSYTEVSQDPSKQQNTVYALLIIVGELAKYNIYRVRAGTSSIRNHNLVTTFLFLFGFHL